MIVRKSLHTPWKPLTMSASAKHRTRQLEEAGINCSDANDKGVAPAHGRRQRLPFFALAQSVIEYEDAADSGARQSLSRRLCVVDVMRCEIAEGVGVMGIIAETHRHRGVEARNLQEAPRYDEGVNVIEQEEKGIDQESTEDVQHLRRGLRHP